jgi:hypothetical protein
MPGGGYVRIVVDREGYEIARWLRIAAGRCSCYSIGCPAMDVITKRRPSMRSAQHNPRTRRDVIKLDRIAS